MSLSSPNGGIRLTLDVAIGETSVIDSGDKEKLNDLATRVKDLNARLNDIRREQVFQRVCCQTLSTSNEVQKLMFLNRNAKPNSVINLKAQTPVSFDGCSSSSPSSEPPAHGNCPT